MKVSTDRGAVVVLLSAVVWLLVAPGRAQTDAERWFLWHEANARMAAAATPEDFLKAAESYHQLVRMGVRNGPLFYNLGTALLLAQEYDTALAYLLRAERYLGTTPEIRQNLELAAEGVAQKGGAGLPWYRPLFFWHFGLPATARATAAALSFTAVWFGLVLQSFKKSAAAHYLLVVSVLSLVLFGSSTLISLVQESRANAALPAVGHATSSVEAPGAKNNPATRGEAQTTKKQP